MHRGVLAIAWLTVSLLHGQITQQTQYPRALHGTDPRSDVAAYPAHVQGDTFAIGAEYLAHSLMSGGQTFFAAHYLVVDVALYPAPGQRMEIAASRFTLHINGKRGFPPQPPGFVAADLKYPDWEQQRSVEASVETVDASGNPAGGVSIGRPRMEGRFPGDNRPDQTRRPPIPQAPDPQQSAGIERQPVARADEVAVDAALIEEPAKNPVSGYIYFAFKGKLKSIHSLDLHYQEGERSLVIHLK